MIIIGGLTEILKTNKLYNMDCREGLKQLEPESINCCITSPPYYDLRDYKIEPSIWDGDPDCEHDFELEEKKCGGGHSGGVETSGLFTKEQAIKRKEGTGSGDIIKEGFCSRCDAWKGTLGLEPNFELYIKHLCDIYDLVWQVLKPTGTNWVNMGDTYAGSGVVNKPEWKHKESVGTPNKHRINYTSKCLLMLPQRFAIEMVNRGWILRNVIIWHKPNCMPSSAKDRFTVDFEYVYFFVKSNKTQYWINEKIGSLVDKKPLGTHGIENIDWNWYECDKCLGTGIKHKKCKFCVETGWYYDEFLRPRKCPKCRGLGRIKMNSECKSCKGKGIKKHNFWIGRQYFFEQQREAQSLHPSSVERRKYPTNYQTVNFKNNGTQKGVKPSKVFSKENVLPLGKNKRTVWTIPTKPNPETHFATFPPTLVEPMILSGCPKFICKECGKPREKIIETVRPKNYEPSEWDKKHGEGCGGQSFSRNRPLSKIFDIALKSKQEFRGYSDCGCGVGYDSKYNKTEYGQSLQGFVRNDSIKKDRDQSRIDAKKLFPNDIKKQKEHIKNVHDHNTGNPKKIVGLTDCNHGSKWKAGIVLDPFAGIGTTLLTAWKLGRNYIGFEISKEYCEIANKKLDITKYVRLDNFIEEKIVFA